MYKDIDFEKARDVMLELMRVMSPENIPLPESYGRVLAEDLTVREDIPPFDRSPFDGYAFKTADTLGASRETPVTLRVIEEVPAGSLPTQAVTPGTAVKVLTGSPVPEGADGIIRYEDTQFTAETVTLFEPVIKHDIVRRGEDVRQGQLLAGRGDRIDPALMGSLAAQGVSRPLVFKLPRIGIISTGNELLDIGEEMSAGKIRDTNRYMLEGAVRHIGAVPVNLGTARDTAEEVAELIRKGIGECDAVISTGGASVGDYDVAPKAIELAGAELVVRKVLMKPGSACAYGISKGKAVFCLSGNPAAAMVNFYAVALPCLRKLMGLAEYMSKTAVITLAEDFNKPSPQTRLLRGRLDLSGGEVLMRFSGQGNAMLHSTNGCDVLAVIPAGSGKVGAGIRLKAFLI